MSFLSGYDLIIEISNATLGKLIKTNFKIQGVYANPPFEVNLPITDSGANGMAHLIANDLKLNLNADDIISNPISVSLT